MSTTGPSPPKRGRPKDGIGCTHIILKEDVHEMWMARKLSIGFSSKTNSEFARHLLLNFCADMDQSDDACQAMPMESPGDDQRLQYAVSSTPVGKGKPTGNIPLSPIVEHDRIPVDIALTSGHEMLDSSRVESLSLSINPEFGMYIEDPFGGDTSSESDDDARSSLTYSDGSESDEDNDPEATLSATEDDDLFRTTSQSVRYNGTKGEEDMDVSSLEDTVTIDKPQKAESLEVRNERLAEEMQEAFNVLTGLGNHNSIFNEHFKRKRVIVDVAFLLELFNNGCQHLSCSGTSRVLHTKLEGAVLSIGWECSEGHLGCWKSSKVLCQKKGQAVFTNSLLIAAGLFMSGNNYDKLALFTQFVGLSFISKATYNRMQTHFVIPEVKRYWEQMKDEIWEILSGEPVVLCGDGRNDSPGHSAKYCMYALMDQHLDLIIDVEVVDKRQTGGNSTNMEVFGLTNILERMVGKIIISEVVTDASAAVIALVRKMKEKHPKDFGDLFHALDIWHKSVKLSKKLAKAAKPKGCEAVREWSEAIRNHFWFVCQNCNGDVAKLKDSWFGVLHHIAGEHEWIDGECDHGPLVATEVGKTHLHKNSKAFEAIRKVVLDQRFLRCFHQYVTFRHTSKLENFNSMLLKYASKRVGYQNDAFTGRTYLAAIDHNSHAFRKPDVTASGELKYNKVYSKRSKNWRIETVKEAKTYDFWSTIGTRILKKRIDDEETILHKVEVPAGHPKKIAPINCPKANTQDK